MDDELTQISRGNRERARALAATLRYLADQDDQPELQELAQGVLAGRTTLRAAIMSDAYAPVLTQRMSDFFRRQRERENGVVPGQS